MRRESQQQYFVARVGIQHIAARDNDVTCSMMQWFAIGKGRYELRLLSPTVMQRMHDASKHSCIEEVSTHEQL
jgi:hypothetical protein